MERGVYETIEIEGMKDDTRISLIPNKDPFLSDYYLWNKYKLLLCPKEKGFS